ncbi:uncharacterized protein [Apostichopus japonicus]|uniref:uncharacterized protein isoform X1 n=1 Tax=Stichopus japonicus TaxID=307972 RepID=UPI003AB679B8
MQGIKMTNEAIHERMKTLKGSVVKSEDSVKRLVAEIKMLGQRVVQSHKAVQKEEEPGTFSSFFHLGLNQLRCPPWNCFPRDLQKTLNLEETWEDDETSDRDNELESQAPVADSLIMDMKASISSLSKVRSEGRRRQKSLFHFW